MHDIVRSFSYTALGRTGAYQNRCCGCEMLALIALDINISVKEYVLGAFWVFLLPCLGLIAGCVVVAVWQGPAWRQAAALIGGVVVGVIAGIAGRHVTLSTRPAALQDTLRGES